MKKYELNIEGMKCEGCVRRVSNVLATIKKIKSYNVLLDEKKIIIETEKEDVINEVIDKLASLDFKVTTF